MAKVNMTTDLDVIAGIFQAGFDNLKKMYGG